jgi:hypothetical protein
MSLAVLSKILDRAVSNGLHDLKRCPADNGSCLHEHCCLVPRRQPIISCLHQLAVVVVWDRVRQFVSSERRLYVILIQTHAPY